MKYILSCLFNFYVYYFKLIILNVTIAIFEHGQLYVAVSRVTSPQNLSIYISSSVQNGYYDDHDAWITRNEVYNKLLI